MIDCLSFPEKPNQIRKNVHICADNPVGLETESTAGWSPQETFQRERPGDLPHRL